MVSVGILVVLGVGWIWHHLRIVLARHGLGLSRVHTIVWWSDIALIVLISGRLVIVSLIAKMP